MSFFVTGDKQYGVQQGDLARALGALITFVLDRRVDVLAEIPMSMEDQPQAAMFLPINGTPDRALLAPMEVDQPRLSAMLKEILGLLAGVPEKDAEVIGTALDMHYGACLLFDRDLASAYTLLVAGLETMSRTFGQPPSDWSAWEQADRWDRFSDEIGLSDGQAEALRARLMRDRQLRLNETFATYATETLPDSFWDGEWRDWTYEVEMPRGVFMGGHWQPPTPVEQLVPRDRDVLKLALRRSYNARSGFVHSGDRIGDATEELFLALADTPVGQRLSFPGLRLILRGLIDHEIKSRTADGGIVPELVMTLDPRPDQHRNPAASWSTPKPGARRKAHHRR